MAFLKHIVRGVALLICVSGLMSCETMEAAGRSSSPDMDLAGEAEAEADAAVQAHLREALQRYQNPNQRTGDVPEVMWQEAARHQGDADLSDASRMTNRDRGGVPTTVDQRNTTGIMVSRDAPMAHDDQVHDGTQASRSDHAMQVLGKHLRDNNDPMVARAVREAAMAIFDPNHTMDPDILKSLEPEQLRAVQAYRRLILALARDITDSPESIDWDTLRNILGDPPAVASSSQTIRIANVQLCRRVQGFGVYDTLGSTALIAGRRHPMIVYVELENFTTQQHGEADFEVKLEQEVVLYNKADGLAVWRHPPVDIVDRSKNTRRDFFTVQMIHLPERLTVGEFTLKVRVTDRHSNTLDERNVSLQVVADYSLTQGP